MNEAADGTLETEQPTLTGKETFRRGGFKPATEVIAEAGEQAAPVEGEAAGDPEFEAAVLADPNIIIEGEVPGEAPEVQAAAEGEGEKPKPKFRIGGKEFEKQQDAFDYAEQLEQERVANDAFRQGIEAATRVAPGNPAPVTPEPKEIDPEYYTNPQAYFAKQEALTVQKAKAAVQAEMQQQQKHKETWDGFYADYPDLAESRLVVDAVLSQNWNTLQHVETKQALKQLAEKSRAVLEPYAQKKMPKVTLPAVKTAASPGGAPGVTSGKTASKPLSFVEQQRNLKKNRAQIR